MKLAIPNNGAAAKIVTDAEAEALHETHRLVSVRETSRGRSVVPNGAARGRNPNLTRRNAPWASWRSGPEVHFRAGA
jgi:hypothetical protein